MYILAIEYKPSVQLKVYITKYQKYCKITYVNTNFLMKTAWVVDTFHISL